MNKSLSESGMFDLSVLDINSILHYIFNRLAEFHSAKLKLVSVDLCSKEIGGCDGNVELIFKRKHKKIPEWRAFKIHLGDG